MEAQLREAVGVFDDPGKLDKAISELEATEFARHDISVIGNRQKIEERFGTDTVKPEWLEDNPNAPRGAPVHPEEKTIGATAFIGVLAYFGGCIAALSVNPTTNVILFAAIAWGSLLGALVGGLIIFIIGRRLRKNIQKQISKGGLLLWVRTPEPKKEEAALAILNKYGARHVHVHNII